MNVKTLNQGLNENWNTTIKPHPSNYLEKKLFRYTNDTTILRFPSILLIIMRADKLNTKNNYCYIKIFLNHTIINILTIGVWPNIEAFYFINNILF